MEQSDKEALWRELMGTAGEEMDFEVERDTIQPGRSFSAEAMTDINDAMIIFVGTRLMRAWEQRNEPPTRLTITVKAVAS